MKRITSVFVCMLFFGFSVIAQDIQLTGKVTAAEDGTVLPGVSVVVKGTTVGTTSSADGMYSLTVPEDATVVFSFIGMKTKEVALSGQTTLNIEMEMEATGLEEVVVTALGITRDKKSLGYAVQEVDGEDISRTKETNVINSLSGKVAGVQIRNNTNLGGSSNIIIRGSTSLMGNNQALFVVDGVPIDNYNSNNAGQMRGRSGYDYGNPVSDINSNDIESVSVLKGAAATALYGSRAANGVIIITTKKGKKTGDKSLQVSVNSSTMISKIDKSTFPKYQQSYGAGYGPFYSGPLGDGRTDIPSQYWGLHVLDYDNDGEEDYVVPSYEDGSMGAAYDPNLMVFTWDAFYPELPTYKQKSPFVASSNGPETFFETGVTLTNGFDVIGGTSVSTFRFAYTNTTGTGILPNSELKKNNFTLNGSFDITKNLKISASAMYNNTYTKGRNHTGYSDNIMSMFRQWYDVGVDIQKQKEYYELTGDNITWNPFDWNNTQPHYWDNPYWARYENYQDDTRDRLLGYAQVDYEITRELSFMGRVSVDSYTFLQEERKAVGSVSGEFGVDRPEVTSGYARREISFRESNFDARLNYHKDLTSTVDLTAFVGTNIRRSVMDEVFASTNSGIAVPETYSLANSSSPMLPPEETYERIGVNGYFGSVSFGIMKMVYIDGTYRYDISSTLPEDNRGYGYYSATSSFIFSEMIDASWLSLGKIRLGYAQVGNDADWGRVNDFFVINPPFQGNSMARYPRGKNNYGLKPEISGSLEGGLEMNFVQNRLGIDLSLYKVNTVDQVVPLSVSYTTGFRSKFVNVGEVENKGVEVMVFGSPVKTSDYEWRVGINWSKNNNKVVSLGGDIQNLQIEELQGGLTINAREGEPYGTIQGTGFEYSPDGRKIVGSNGYYAKTGTSDIILGNIQPDWNGSLINTFTYKNISLNVLLDMQMGGSIFSLDQWYGMGTGLYAETDYLNDLGNPVRGPIYAADGTELIPYITLPDHDPADGYAAKSGGMILDGVVEVTDNDGNVTGYEENTRRVNGGDYRVWGWSRNPNEAFIYDATYVKLREISITYNFPQFASAPFIKGLSLSLVGSNLAILHKNLPHADPEASQGAGNVQGWQSGVMPATRNFGFNLNVKF